MNETDSAIEEFKRAILSARGKDANLLLLARYSLAATLESNGNLTDAIEQWEEINRVNPRYRDTLIKLEQYRDLRGDDTMKDFLTNPTPVFDETCRAIVRHLGLELLELKVVSSSIITAVGVPREGGKRTIMRQRVYVKVHRDTVVFGVKEVKQLIEEAKTLRCARAIFVAPMKFGTDAVEFTSGRQITLIGGKELSGLLNEIERIAKEGAEGSPQA